jgi:hypothetical protein
VLPSVGRGTDRGVNARLARDGHGIATGVSATAQLVESLATTDVLGYMY